MSRRQRSCSFAWGGEEESDWSYELADPGCVRAAAKEEGAKATTWARCALTSTPSTRVARGMGLPGQCDPDRSPPRRLGSAKVFVNIFVSDVDFVPYTNTMNLIYSPSLYCAPHGVYIYIYVCV